MVQRTAISPDGVRRKRACAQWRPTRALHFSLEGISTLAIAQKESPIRLPHRVATADSRLDRNDTTARLPR